MRISTLVLFVSSLAVAPSAQSSPAIQKMATLVMNVGGGEIHVVLRPGPLEVTDSDITAWVETAARSVEGYFGRFPVKRVNVVVTPTEGRGVGDGTTDTERGVARIRVNLGLHTTKAQLEWDWKMTHEMVHLAFPDLPESQRWLEEGVATYVEPFARAGIGALSPQRAWQDQVEGMPKGLPRPGDKGLNQTPTWGRTYWGGALFFLLADVEIRTRTDNKKGLRDALQGILAAGAVIGHEWTAEKVLAVGDKAIGTEVLGPLYLEMRDTPVDVNLAELWKNLGVSATQNGIAFDSQAPLAPVRLGITGRSELAD